MRRWDGLPEGPTSSFHFCFRKPNQLNSTPPVQMGWRGGSFLTQHLTQPLLFPHLDLLLSVWPWLVLAQQLALVGSLVDLQALPVLLNLGPGPHVAEASDVDLHDAVESVSPPEGSRRPQCKWSGPGFSWV